MKALKYLTILMIGLLLYSCEVDYLEDPNQTEIPPTYGIMNRVQKDFLDNTRDEWFSGRQSLLWMQYWQQVNYTEEDRFQYRENVNEYAWNDIYGNAQDLIDLIALNTDEATAASMIEFSNAPNINQIAATRIMLAYVYLHAVELWGNVPYWSYSGTNPDFQANMIKTDGITQPVYASEEDIYLDMLSDLKLAINSIDTEENMIDGDNFYNGDAKQWIKFANSLRLRIANRIKGVSPEGVAVIAELTATDVFESNADNAAVTYEGNALNGAPMYVAFVVDARDDFAPSCSFVDLLKGDRGTNVGVLDPRLDIFVNDNDDGQKVGIPLTGSNEEVKAFTDKSWPGSEILKADATLEYMEYAEVCFIMSENNGWDQTWYEKGIRASMEKFGVANSDINAYIAAVQPADEENVMTQKYIALYMQPSEAWSEYRRTGYPHTLIKPNVPYTYTYMKDVDGVLTETTVNAEFLTIGGLTDLPARNKYLLNEANINGTNVVAAGVAMGGDLQTTKLWWQP
ncbi:MAG: SusD/RagB family nutrient-binding outer membrane lipoprotein [Bacteroidetes bacterium]|nr:SusD/RagB family nutrient-binding outer membrane lipoprotein [Bacteroidota bacterium]